MERVTQRDTWRRRISNDKKLRRGNAAFTLIDYFIARRELGWLGHVSRIDCGRFLRRMLCSPVNYRRPIGSPNAQLTRPMEAQFAKRWRGSAFRTSGGGTAIVTDRAAWNGAFMPGSFSTDKRKKRGARAHSASGFRHMDARQNQRMVHSILPKSPRHSVLFKPHRP